MKFQYVISPPFINRSSWNLTCTFPSDNVPTHLVARRARSAISDCLVRSVLGLIRSCTNVTLFNVIHFQSTGHKLAYLRVTGTLYLAQLIHACQNDLHINNLLGWMILCLYMYIYNRIMLWLVILSLDCATTISKQRRPACPLPESSVS